MKYKLVKQYIKDKIVLDLGSLDHGKHTKMFNFITKHSKLCMGIDILSSNRKMIFKENAETMELVNKFDVITAMDFIEHIKNQDKLIENLKHHLKPQGILIVGTPNPYSLMETVAYFLGKQKVNKQHYFWHTEETMQNILRENGMEIIEKKYYGKFKLNYFFVIRRIEK